MGRPRKVHYPALLGFLPVPALCETPNPIVTLRHDEVTCLRCMFFLELYIPLEKLAEHQKRQRSIERYDRGPVNGGQDLYS